MEFYGSSDIVPHETDDNEDALEEPVVAERRTDGDEDAPEELPLDREDPISFSEDERSEIDKRLPPPASPSSFGCLDAGCTWPCAHHSHRGKELQFSWHPEFQDCGYQHPEVTKIQSEMNDCQFCHIFFSLGQSDCSCGANARNDLIIKSGGCRCILAQCRFRPNGQLSHLHMTWTCGQGHYELGLPTATGMEVGLVTYNLFNKSF